MDAQDADQAPAMAPPVPEPVSASVVVSQRTLPVNPSRQQFYAAVAGAGVTLAWVLARAMFRRKKVPKPAAKAATAASSPVPAAAFGSPVDPSTPTLHKAPKWARDQGLAAKGQLKRTAPPVLDLGQVTAPPAMESPDTEAHGSDQKASRPLPPGQITKTLKQVQELQEENAKIRSFMQEFAAASEKLKALEAENERLKAVQSQLEVELADVRAKQSQPANGDELTRFKRIVGFPASLDGGVGPARSVCSDADALLQRGLLMGADSGSIDGSQSVFDAGARRKYSVLNRLAAAIGMAPISEHSGAQAWGRDMGKNGTPLSGTPLASPRARAPLTPRSGRHATEAYGPPKDVMQLLEGFAGGH